VTENWRSYLAFTLVGAIVIACQSLSGGMASNRPAGLSGETRDSGYRDVPRSETIGPGD